jgi:hypothetical protein
MLLPTTYSVYVRSLYFKPEFMIFKMQLEHHHDDFQVKLTHWYKSASGQCPTYCRISLLNTSVPHKYSSMKKTMKSSVLTEDGSSESNRDSCSGSH